MSAAVVKAIDVVPRLPQQSFEAAALNLEPRLLQLDIVLLLVQHLNLDLSPGVLSRGVVGIALADEFLRAWYWACVGLVLVLVVRVGDNDAVVAAAAVAPCGGSCTSELPPNLFRIHPELSHRCNEAARGSGGRPPPRTPCAPCVRGSCVGPWARASAKISRGGTLPPLSPATASRCVAFNSAGRSERLRDWCSPGRSERRLHLAGEGGPPPPLWHHRLCHRRRRRLPLPDADTSPTEEAPQPGFVRHGRRKGLRPVHKEGDDDASSCSFSSNAVVVSTSARAAAANSPEQNVVAQWDQYSATRRFPPSCSSSLATTLSSERSLQASRHLAMAALSASNGGGSGIHDTVVVVLLLRWHQRSKARSPCGGARRCVAGATLAWMGPAQPQLRRLLPSSTPSRCRSASRVVEKQ
jgi:hypothetical protein